MIEIPKIKLNDGNEIPMIGLGTFHGLTPDIPEVEYAVKTAIEVGYRHFDGAYNYQNEEGIGNALEYAIKNGIVKREDLFLTSKLWLTFTRRDRVIKGLKRTLKALKTDYLNLYLMHWPMSFKQDDDEHFPIGSNGLIEFDEEIDYIETWKGMEECVEKGMVKSIGVSNFNTQQLERLLSNCNIKPVVNQIESHPYLPQYELINYCHKRNIEITAYSPLGNPTLASPAFKRPGQGKLMIDPTVVQLSHKYNRSFAQILLRYQIQRNVIVIPRSVIRNEMIDNLQVFGFQLSNDDMKLLDALECEWRSFPFDYLGVPNHKNYPFNKH